ncbi:Hsp70 family protein [Mycolicibacterium smegmatis]|uniref:Molecular chaperone n=1 Tax=Mycolicibacterium smegmatis (strain MKD8) TaxID=1214915 RepID=A0A2U9PIZ7_MYCSE|nr:Hsp70 family protein [Mycolicibacterium smegmatis]AWT51703.1 hypothetical protein D806_007120 [Mycolicibacterium smegmatis MKD8]
MSDPLGLSIGTTNLVAARVGNQPEIRRSVLTLSADRTPQVGVPESGAGVTLTGFVERVGDPVPLVAPDGASYPADTLLVEALDAMVEVAGGPSQQLVIAVPAHWGPTTLRALRNALRTNPSLSHGGMPARLVPDAVASLAALRVNPGLPAGGVVALVDFGGSGTSITLADAASGFEPIDETTRHPDFSGDQIDQALLTHVLDGIAEAGGIDPAGTAAVGSLARLREECRAAKERLSALTATDLAVELPGYSATIRVTRDELETLMRPPLTGVLDTLDNALERNGFGWPAVAAVVTIGGGASIPLVTQQLSEHSRAVVVTTPQPALDAAVGAALIAAGVTASGPADAEAMTGAAPTLGVAAASETAGPDAATASAPAVGATPDQEGSSTFRALAWSEDEPGDDVVPYTGPDVVNPYAANPYANPYAGDTSARPAVQYVPPTGPIEEPAGGWKRLPLTVFGIAVAAVLVAVGGVTYALTSSTSSTPTTEVRTAEPKPLTPEPEPSAVAPPPVAEPPPPVTEAPPPPPPVTITEVAPPPPVTETHVVTQTTTPPTTTTTTTTSPTTTEPTTTTTTPTTTETTTTTTTPTTTTNPMTTTYITVPFVPVPIPIQVPSREQPQPQYPPQYPQQYPQNPQYPFQPYP